MPEDQYSLADLARLAGVTPRTVRYYVAQGLLPSPEAAGPATRYGDAHLARLRIIRRLQRDHLPLAEIRARLGRMDAAEILTAGSLADEAPDADPTADDALAFVHGLMAQSGVTPTTTDKPPPAAAPARAGSLLKRMQSPPPAPAAPPHRVAEPAALYAVAVPPPASGPPAPSSTQPDRSTWERLVITPDVELHVRRPLDRRANRRVDQLERIARELFDEDL